MQLTKENLLYLKMPIMLAVIMLVSGIASIVACNYWLTSMRRAYQIVDSIRLQQQTKLTQAKEEELEIKRGLVLYRELLTKGVIGEENRLDLIETFSKIKVSAHLFDLRYEIEPQQSLDGTKQINSDMEFRVSAVKLNLSLLHEGQLFNFFSDLERTGKGYYQLKSCLMKREPKPEPTSSMGPQLRAECELNWITVRAKK